MLVVGPDANRTRAGASFITSTGTMPRSNGPPVVASLISSGVVPKRKTSLWPEALSNCVASSPKGPVMAPPAKIWSSAPRTLAIGNRTSARHSIEAAADRICRPVTLSWNSPSFSPNIVASFACAVTHHA